MKKTQECCIRTIQHIHFYEPDDFLILDAATQSNLELLKIIRMAGATIRLFAVLDGSVNTNGFAYD